jgi:hypothetical protein
MGGRDILALAVDATGVLWADTYQGVLRYEAGQLRRPPEAAALADVPIAGLAADGNAVWLSSPQGVVRAPVSGNVPWQHYTTAEDGLPVTWTGAIVADGAGGVWVGTRPWEAIQPSSDVDEVIDQLCPAIMRLPDAKDGDYGREYCGLMPSDMIRSPQDKKSATQLYSLRIQFDTACNIQKLVPYLTENRPGELYERRGKHWKLIGLIKPEDKARGFITSVDD